MTILSIGMPVYNGASFIKDSLKSLLTQSESSFELIISDNASTDKTEDICKYYAAKDKRIRYIRQTINMGVTNNFQFVLREAKCKYFMWAAADDLWDKDFVKKCVCMLNNYPIISLAFTKYICKSILFPVLSIDYFPDYSFTYNENPYLRVYKYICLNNITHKANLIYGIWRHDFIFEMMSRLHNINTSQNVNYGLDIAQLACALSLTMARQVQDAYFIKRYMYFPPGHSLNWLFYLIRNILLNKPANVSKLKENAKIHTELISKCIHTAGKWDIRYESLLVKKYKMLSNDIITSTNVIKSILHSAVIDYL
jgi:glycosyltransferase involved in cell wall biosynthesis